MKVVADAGPLMALAKVDALAVLFRLYPKVLTPPAVYEETVVAGQRLGVPDAALLEAFYRTGALEVVIPAIPSLPVPPRLGWGEEEGIRLAIEQSADWLLMDDLDARREAQSNFQAAGSLTQVKGTLGIIVSAQQEGHLSQGEAIDYVNVLSRRQDVWISADLCRRVINILSR